MRARERDSRASKRLWCHEQPNLIDHTRFPRRLLDPGASLQEHRLHADCGQAPEARFEPPLNRFHACTGGFELPDGGIQTYVRDPAGNIVELDYRDASTIPRDEVPEYKRLADVRPQDEDAAVATLWMRHLATAD